MFSSESKRVSVAKSDFSRLRGTIVFSMEWGIFIALMWACGLTLGEPIKRVSRYIHEGQVARYENNTSLLRHGRTIYMLTQDRRKHTFPDRYTFNAFGYDFQHAKEVSREVINSYRNGEPIKSLYDHHANEAMLAMFKSGFLRNTTKVFEALNLNYVYFENYVILAWRVTEQKFRVVALPRRATFDSFGAAAAPDIPRDLEKFKKHGRVDFHASESCSEVEGEDPRMFVMNNRLWVVFATRYRKKPEIRMTLQEMFISVQNSGTVHEVEMKRPIFDMAWERGPQTRLDQKNWMPFYTETGDLRFVHSIEPLRIIAPDISIPCCGDEAIKVGKTGRSFAKIYGVSEGTPGLSKKGGIFPYGELRGGTPAYLVPTQFKGSKSYLAFFHASNEPSPPPGGKPKYTDVLKTYTMGAIVFSAQEPYELQAISRQPITHQSMYSGKWPHLPWAYYHMDYIVFPTNYLYEAETDTIYLQYGHQDRETWVAELSLTGLLKSLVAVKGG